MKKTILLNTMIMFLFYHSALFSQTISVPQLINYQGMLTNAEGHPLETKDYVLSFRIYNHPTSGGSIWGPQIFNGTTKTGYGPKIPVVRGHFNVILGPKDTSGLDIADAFKSNNTYLEIKVGNNTPISPRQQVLTTPYAFQAQKAVSAIRADKATQADKAVWADNAKKSNISSTAETLSNSNVTIARNGEITVKNANVSITGNLISSNINTSNIAGTSITLKEQPRCRLDLTSNLNLDYDGEIIKWNKSTDNVNGCWKPNNKERIVAPQDGLYLLNALIKLSNKNVRWCHCSFTITVNVYYKNGSKKECIGQWIGNTSSNSAVTISLQHYMKRGSFIYIESLSSEENDDYNFYYGSLSAGSKLFFSKLH